MSRIKCRFGPEWAQNGARIMRIYFEVSLSKAPFPWHISFISITAGAGWLVVQRMKCFDNMVSRRTSISYFFRRKQNEHLCEALLTLPKGTSRQQGPAQTEGVFRLPMDRYSSSFDGAPFPRRPSYEGASRSGVSGS